MDTSLDYFFNTNYDPINPILENPMLLINNSELEKQFNCSLESYCTKTQMENKHFIIASPNDGSSVSEQIPSGKTKEKFPNNFIPRKRKAVSKGKSQKVAVNDQENRDSKRNKTGQNKGIQSDNKQKEKQDDDPPKDYIHVRARRGQATDSHSLAERVRREKIGERMKLLQDLVPGCNKVTGKALMLDEIINYVQSLQCQVEYLSIKLATLDPSDFVTDSVLPKDVISSTYALDSSFQAKTDFLTHCSLDPSDTTLFTGISSQLHFVHDFGQGFSQFSGSYEDDLQSMVQMGFGQNPSSKLECHSQSFLGSDNTHSIEL